jgi:putative restriction endonuclease
MVHAPAGLKSRKSNTDPPKTELLKNKVSGGFSADVQAVLRADPTLVTDIAIRLLENHFPESLHADILAAAVYVCRFRYDDEVGRPSYHAEPRRTMGWSCASRTTGYLRCGRHCSVPTLGKRFR